MRTQYDPATGNHVLVAEKQITRHQPGDRVKIGDSGEITATIEEIIWARGMSTPFYLVEWWHEGQLVSRRLHAEECR